jgi:hypothetical protein
LNVEGERRSFGDLDDVERMPRHELATVAR